MPDLDIPRKRALYRATHRGTKELDILLGRFAEHYVHTMAPPELAAFEEFLASPDPDIEQWMRTGEAPAAFAQVVVRLRAFHGLGE